MRRVTYYRRCGHNAGEYEGIRERVVWGLHKGAMTLTELVEKYGMPRTKMRSCMSSLAKSKMTDLNIHHFENEDGTPEIRYTLVKVHHEKAYKPAPEFSLKFLSQKSMLTAGENNRERNIKLARKRAKLIAAGVYRDSMG